MQLAGVVECIGALDGMHWMECIGWCALDGANVTTVHHQTSKRGGGIDK